MPQKCYAVNQIVAKLHKADGDLVKGTKVRGICKLLEVTEQNYYRWRQKHVGMKSEMAK
jgi:putative transposase